MPEWAKMWVPPAVVFAAFIGYDYFVRDHGSEPYQPSVVKVARQYKASLSPTYHTAAEKVRSHVFEDKKAVGEYLQSSAKPLAAAMDTAITPLIDKDGKFENPDGVAEVLDEISKGFK